MNYRHQIIVLLFLSILLALSVYLGLYLFGSALFAHSWQHGFFMIQVGLPLSMWCVAGFFAVVRFLGYLDLRIRQEGWEVELKLRAEAQRLASKLI